MPAGLRVITPDELEAWDAASRAAFHDDPLPGDVTLDARTLEPERCLAVEEDGRIVATTATLTRTMTIPGGDAIRVGAVSGVGVRPGHTRRGHLGALMRRQLDDIHAAGEPLAALWASEGAIYGRYGFGSATRRVGYEVNRPRAAFRSDAALPPEPARLADPAGALADMRSAYERARPGRTGLLDRDDLWWERVLYDPEHRREGMSRRRAAVQAGPDGEPAGYALYAAKEAWDEHGPAGRVEVRELVAATPQAHLGLWRFLLSLDLVRADRRPARPRARGRGARRRVPRLHAAGGARRGRAGPRADARRAGRRGPRLPRLPRAVLPGAVLGGS